MQGGLVYCSPPISTVFYGKILGEGHDRHPRARYGGSISTLFFLSSLFVLYVVFYLSDFLVSFAAYFLGGQDNHPC